MFLDDSQRVLLADFGLCMHFTPEQRRYVRPREKTSLILLCLIELPPLMNLDSFVQCCGSMLYTAPEVIKQQPYVGPEIDIWGLGILRTYRSINARTSNTHAHGTHAHAHTWSAKRFPFTQCTKCCAAARRSRLIRMRRRGSAF